MDLSDTENALFEDEARDYAELLHGIGIAKSGRTPAGLELTCIGNTGGASNVVQCEPCGGFLMRCAGRTVIVDPGENAVTFLVSRGFDPYQITDVLASHAHNDHVGELSLAVSAATNLGLAQPCDCKVVVAPALMDYTHASSTKFGFTLPAYAWQASVVSLFWREAAATLIDGSVIQSVRRTELGNGIQVHATEARHGTVMVTGFTLETPFGKIGYSGDTEYFEGLSEYHRGADVLWLNMNTLAIDAGVAAQNENDRRSIPVHTHLGYVGACRLISEVRPKTAVVTHFGAQLRARREEIQSALRTRFEPLGISVFCPRNGDSYFFETALSEPPVTREFCP